jgi:hypothetical protein
MSGRSSSRERDDRDKRTASSILKQLQHEDEADNEYFDDSNVIAGQYSGYNDQEKIKDEKFDDDDNVKENPTSSASSQLNTDDDEKPELEPLPSIFNMLMPSWMVAESEQNDTSPKESGKVDDGPTSPTNENVSPVSSPLKLKKKSSKSPGHPMTKSGKIVKAMPAISEEHEESFKNGSASFSKSNQSSTTKSNDKNIPSAYGASFFAGPNDFDENDDNESRKLSKTKNSDIPSAYGASFFGGVQDEESASPTVGKSNKAKKSEIPSAYGASFFGGVQDEESASPTAGKSNKAKKSEIPSAYGASFFGRHVDDDESVATNGTASIFTAPVGPKQILVPFVITRKAGATCWSAPSWTTARSTCKVVSNDIVHVSGAKLVNGCKWFKTTKGWIAETLIVSPGAEKVLVPAKKPGQPLGAKIISTKFKEAFVRTTSYFTFMEESKVRLDVAVRFDVIYDKNLVIGLTRSGAEIVTLHQSILKSSCPTVQFVKELDFHDIEALDAETMIEDASLLVHYNDVLQSWLHEITSRIQIEKCQCHDYLNFLIPNEDDCELINSDLIAIGAS